MKRVSIVVPCFNESESLPAYINAIQNVQKDLEYELEIILVDDGSKDNTLSLIKGYAKELSFVKYISLSRNFGKESAMLAGFEHATGEFVGVMDADLQDPPTLIPAMINELENGEYDAVATRRVTRTGEPKIRSICARMFYKLINKISDADIVDGARDFRIMTRQMTDAILSMKEYNRFSKGIFGWVGFKTKWLEYENTKRVAGETKWSFGKLFKYSIDGIINFSEAPLHIASMIGIAMTGISFLLIIFIIIRKLIFGDPVAGWPSLVCLVTFIGGVQLFCIGIIGQYIAKTYLETKHRPVYIIKEKSKELMQ